MNTHEHSDTDTEYDVVVVGGGNAAFSAAHAARERGARVLMLEKATREEAGGNSFYTAGAFRAAHNGLDDLLPLVDDASRERAEHTVLPPYPAEHFRRDMERLTDGRNDPGLTRVLVESSRDIVRWLAEKGVRWQLLYERQTYLSNGEWVFFGGLNIGTVDGGKGLVSHHTEQAVHSGIEMGGLFWGNYPGGSGLTAGTVLGRIAGHDATDSM
ncbi:choline dehydrogenase-like flavoprotein [Lipingzhangella halophila]|uniref:Choline dehydrogenase-like flavoprotein n=1 Tax=Lipingzhangella halophila TaxID=1783352 RepID=A0A7W7RF84_9ACTN|nr:FAD-dependent oxidoreductase [Lipingzhangella halophila]MBB4930892.1 choline dehydrogenase-like flavoprotein [Lipingzhangella halophila]